MHCQGRPMNLRRPRLRGNRHVPLCEHLNEIWPSDATHYILPIIFAIRAVDRCPGNHDVTPSPSPVFGRPSITSYTPPPPAKVKAETTWYITKSTGDADDGRSAPEATASLALTAGRHYVLHSKEAKPGRQHWLKLFPSSGQSHSFLCQLIALYSKGLIGWRFHDSPSRS